MGYIIFDEASGNLLSVTYQKPLKGMKYISVAEKVVNDFLLGKTQPSEYKIIQSSVFKEYFLVPNNYTFSSLSNNIVISFRNKLYLRSKLLLNIIKSKINSNFFKHLFLLFNDNTTILYNFIRQVFSPYGSMPGDHYISNFLNYNHLPYNVWSSKDIKELPNMCVAPWVHLHTWPNNNVLPCCLTPMDHDIGNLSEKSLKEVWNGEPLRKMRREFIAGERPSSCHRCFSIEDAGGSSYRHHLNTNFHDNLDIIKSTQMDGSVKKLNLKYWDFRFSNICNFKCRTCGPQLSSGWYEDTERLYGNLPKNLPDPKHIQTKPTWQELLPLFDIVEEIYFAGGEPLIMEEHYRILNKLVELERFDVRLSYNTNFSRMKYKKLNVLDIWPMFDNVKIGASVDAMDARAEYMRSGTKWKDIVYNRNDMKEKSPNAEFFANITLGLLNSFHVIDFYKWMVETNFIPTPNSIHINLVQYPKHYTLQALPSEMKKRLTDEYLKMADFCKENKIYPIDEQWTMAVNYMNEEDIWEQEKGTFRKITKSLDVVRNEKFIDVFPELKGLFE